MYSAAMGGLLFALILTICKYKDVRAERDKKPHQLALEAAESGAADRDGATVGANTDPRLFPRERLEHAEVPEAFTQHDATYTRANNNEQLGTSFGTQVKLFLSAADEFFASPEMAQHRAEALRLPLVRNIEAHGFSLQKRFRLFALEKLFHIGAQRAQELVCDKDDSVAETEHVKAGTSPFAGSVMEREESLNDLDDSTGTEAAEHPGNACSEEKAFQHEMGRMNIFLVNGTKEEKLSRASFSNFCKLMEVVRNRSSSTSPGVEIAQLKGIQGEIKPVGQGHMPPSLTKRSGMSKDEYRLSRKAQALRNALWMDSKGQLTQRVTRKANERGQQIVPHKFLGDIRVLFVTASLINLDLHRIRDLLHAGQSVDWMTVKKKGNRMVRMTKHVAKAFGSYVTKMIGSGIDFFKFAWKSFLNAVRRAEKECRNEDLKRLEASAEKAGLPKPSLEGDPAIKDHVKNIAKLNLDQLDKMTEKVRSALKYAKASASSGLESDEDISKETEALSAQVSKVERESQNESSEAAGDKLLQLMADTNIKLEQVQKQVCKKNNLNMVQKLKDVLHKAGTVLKSGAATTAPAMVNRGISASAGFGVIGATGFEELIDFRNREIGQFRWVAGQPGSFTYPPSAALGGYCGIGWKGYKENWTLQDAELTALFVSGGIDVNVWGFNPGLSVSWATDADNSAPGPWVPEVSGLNGISVGFGVSTSLDKIILPFSLGFDYGAAYYTLINTECYADLEDLLMHIWLPSCKFCYGAEAHKMTALRSTIKTLSGSWAIADTMFSVMAATYDKLVREKGHVAECSELSTNNRDDTDFLAMAVGKSLFASAEVMDQLDEQVPKLFDTLTNMNKLNSNMLDSQEWKDWKAKLMSSSGAAGTCANMPRSGSRSAMLKAVKSLQPAELEKECGELELKCKEMKLSLKEEQSRIAIALDLKDAAVPKQSFDILLRASAEDEQLKSELGNWSDRFESSDGHDGFDLSLELEKLPSLKLQKLCVAVGGNCKKVGKFSCKLSRCGYFDDEMLALNIAVAVGGGSLKFASKYQPFGICRKNDDCKFANTECGEAGDPTWPSRCRCKPGFCVHGQELTDGIESSVCRKMTLADDIQLSIATLQREYKGYKLELGKLLRSLDKIINTHASESSVLAVR